MDLGIKGKYALVTGGSHGIGLAIARALADEGCHVAICSRTRERLSKASLDLKQRDVKVLDIPADVMVPQDIERVVQTVIHEWNRIDILVNNVGGGGHWGKESIEETPEDVWTDVYNKNAGAALRFIRLVLPSMRKNKWGRIVTISSTNGLDVTGRPWYGVAKSAEISLMKALSARFELARDGITFNTVAPGAVMIPDTHWEKELEKDPEAFKEMVDKQFTLGRLGEPEEIAHVVAFLCSKKASLLNGACIVANGG